MSELLESVKRLAEAWADYNTKFDAARACSQKAAGMYWPSEATQLHERANSALDDMTVLAARLDFPALAKHLARLERVEAAAKKAAKQLDYNNVFEHHRNAPEQVVAEISIALDAALSENPDVE